MSSDPIPGFTDEQAWALRTVARQAAEETVAKLADRPCGFDCADMAGVRATVYGNGADGLQDPRHPPRGAARGRRLDEARQPHRRVRGDRLAHRLTLEVGGTPCVCSRSASP